MNFQDCKPYLLSPKVAAGRTRFRSPVFFGGCGFMLLWMFVMLSGWMVIWGFAITWDACVLMVYVYALAVQGVVHMVHSIKARRAVTAP